jgi:NAD(P)H-nitrite reductase large subunit
MYTATTNSCEACQNLLEDFLRHTTTKKSQLAAKKNLKTKGKNKPVS